jgi:hypothetical protein
MPRTHSPSNHMAGIVIMRAFSSMDSLPLEVNLQIRTGMAISRRQILSSPLGLLVAVNSLRLLLEGLTTRGSTGEIYMEYITIYYTFCQMISLKLCRSALHKILSQARWPGWL